MKKCIFCAEDIQDEAKVCRFCHKDQEKKFSPTKTHLPYGKTLSWIFSVIFLFIGVANITTDLIPSILFLLAGLTFLPPVVELLKSRMNFNPPRKVRIIAIIILMIIGGMTSNSSQKIKNSTKEETVVSGNSSQASQTSKDKKESSSKATPTNNTEESQPDSIEDFSKVEKAVQKLVDSEIVQKIDVELNQAYVGSAIWQASNIEEKKVIGKLLARYVGTKKGSNAYWVDIFDWQSGKKLAKYSETFGLKIY